MVSSTYFYIPSLSFLSSLLPACCYFSHLS
jgi:hypothetical protein